MEVDHKLNVEKTTGRGNEAAALPVAPTFLEFQLLYESVFGEAAPHGDCVALYDAYRMDCQHGRRLPVEQFLEMELSSYADFSRELKNALLKSEIHLAPGASLKNLYAEYVSAKARQADLAAAQFLLHYDETHYPILHLKSTPLASPASPEASVTFDDAIKAIFSNLPDDHVNRYRAEFQQKKAKDYTLCAKAFLQQKKAYVDFIALARKGGLGKKEEVDNLFASFLSIRSANPGLTPELFFVGQRQVIETCRKYNNAIKEKIAQETDQETLVKSFDFYADLMTKAGRRVRYKAFEDLANRFFEENQPSQTTLRKFEQFIQASVQALKFHTRLNKT